MSRAQAAVEAVSIITFMFFVFIMLVLVVSGRLVALSNERSREVVEDLGTVVKAEFSIAAQSKSGYHREFLLPDTLDGIEYNVTLFTSRMLSTNFSNLVINVSGGWDYVVQLPADIIGKTCSNSINVIDKKNSTVYSVCRA
jgi:hypothetical protein